MSYNNFENLPNNTSEWSVNRNEIGMYMISPYGSSGGSLPLYIPKIMPLIPFNPRRNLRTTKKSINNSVFINASACKPNIPSIIETQDFLIVPPRDNVSFMEPYFYSGTEIITEIENGNVDKIVLTNKVDNSVDIDD